MKPALPAGSLIAVKPEKNYSVGDVVSFRRDGGQIVTHRVTKVLRDETSGGAVYETKGDANNASDRELISKEQIIGEGFFALPYLGYSISFLKTKTGFIVFAIIPSVLIILSEVLSIKNEVNKLLGERKRKGKPTFSFRLFLLLLIVPFITIGRSNAYFSDKEASSGNVMSAGTWGEEEWDKSSLHFDDDYSCQGDCEEIRAKVCNGEDAENMEGPTAWELYWTDSGNPKNGDLKVSGTIDALESGVCQELIFDPEGQLGNYKFKAKQRPGHPGKGELWSETCEIFHCAT
jgi:signal peptidase I/YqxM protein